MILTEESSLDTLPGHSQNVHAQRNDFSNMPKKCSDGRLIYAALELNCVIHPASYDCFSTCSRSSAPSKPETATHVHYSAHLTDPRSMHVF